MWGGCGRVGAGGRERSETGASIVCTVQTAEKERRAWKRRDEFERLLQVSVKEKWMLRR